MTIGNTYDSHFQFRSSTAATGNSDETAEMTFGSYSGGAWVYSVGIESGSASVQLQTMPKGLTQWINVGVALTANAQVPIDVPFGAKFRDVKTGAGTVSSAMGRAQ
jgi:hypothetical protein